MAAATLNNSNKTALFATVLVVAMAALGFASVPLYRAFCAATGYAGTTQRAVGVAVPNSVVGKTISIRFDANQSPALPWHFMPEAATQTVTIGARNIAFFTAENLSGQPVTGQATYNVTPDTTGAYFHKIQCFCFTQQTLLPHQKVRMPVVFYVDPKILSDDSNKNVSEITLSYTFYPVDLPRKAG